MPAPLFVSACLAARAPADLEDLAWDDPVPGDPPAQSPLFTLHTELGAPHVDFGGWDMPVQYSSQIGEHHAVRRAAGVFDVSHMCVVDLRGEKCAPSCSGCSPTTWGGCTSRAGALQLHAQRSAAASSTSSSSTT